MNPTINDFPDQKVLAASVLSSVASKAEQLDLAPIDRLALLSQEADAAGLDLPFVTVAILAWRNQIRELLALYAQTKDTPAVAKPLLLQTRALVRSERFDYATTLEMATVSLVWGLLERQCGSESKAVAAWEWAVEQYEHAPEDERSDAADVARALGFAIGGPQAAGSQDVKTILALLQGATISSSLASPSLAARKQHEGGKEQEEVSKETGEATGEDEGQSMAIDVDTPPNTTPVEDAFGDLTARRPPPLGSGSPVDTDSTTSSSDGARHVPNLDSTPAGPDLPTLTRPGDDFKMDRTE